MHDWPKFTNPTLCKRICNVNMYTMEIVETQISVMCNVYIYFTLLIINIHANGRLKVNMSIL